MDSMNRFVDSTGIIGDPEALASRMRRDGYLLLRGLLPGDAIRSLQRQIGSIARDDGWLNRDQPVEESIADLSGFCVDPDPVYLTTLRKINKLEDYHGLKHHIQGTTEVFTAWIPLIDCPIEVGPLQIASGSNTGEVYDFHIGNGAGGIEITETFAGRWATTDFAVGDVLLFHSMAVHKGMPNRSNKLRMSMDVRFQLVSEPFNPNNTSSDGQPLSWEEIYAGWRSDALKYYWKRLPLTLKTFDRTWYDRRDAMGFALGEAGDPRSRSVLQRIVARDADPAKRARAQRLLEALEKAEKVLS